MTKTLSIDVFSRNETGKGVSRKLRRAGMVPAVMYGHKNTRSLAVRRVDLRRILKTAAGSNAILQIRLDGKQTSVLLKDVQYDPISEEPIHLDLFEISMDQKIRVVVEVKSAGADPVGLKKGGILTHGITDVEVECLPMEIPEAFLADLSGLDVGDSFHVSDLPDMGLTILTPGEQMLFTVVAPTVAAAAEASLEEGASGEVAEPGKTESSSGPGKKTESD